MSVPPPEPDTQITRYEALAALDGEGFEVAPACLLVERAGDGGFRLLAAGTPEAVGHHPEFDGARAVALPGSVLIPGLVNAHTHLDLTHIGPRAHEPGAGFVGWVDHIRRNRHSEEGLIAASVRRGVELLLAGGTVAVGDIAGAAGGRPMPDAARALMGSGMAGVSFVEFFGIGTRREASQERLEGLLPDLSELNTGASGVRVGLQPHAPNTVDLRLYQSAARAAAARGLPICTHLAETPEEREFVARGTGAQRAMLEGLGIWDDEALSHVGKGLHPVAHLRPALEQARFLVAHVNDCDDEAIAILAETDSTVVYCPRASAYFGAERWFGPHRYRDMVRAGIPVALGTDSIVNLPESAARVESGGMSILDEMRLLHRRDGTDWRVLLRMATIHGAAGLGLATESFRFAPGGRLAGLVAVEVNNRRDPGAGFLNADSPPRLLLSTGHGWGERDGPRAIPQV